MTLSDLLLGNTIKTASSGVYLENIDRVEFDDYGNVRIHGYVRPDVLSPASVSRWTTINPQDIDLNS